MSDRTPADETYREETDDAYADSDDPYADDSFFASRGFYPGYGAGWIGGSGWIPFGSADDDAYEDEMYDEGAHGARTSDDRAVDESRAEREGNGWWDEGLISMLLIVGVVLLLFPEPATSTLGVVLIIAGLVAALIDWIG